MMIERCFLAVLVGWLLAVASTSGWADDAPPFPTHPDVWINSSPIKPQQLRGKGVFLWFFEETCPRCRENWPKLIEKADEFKGQPIVFIAVNSGTPPADVREYARSVSCNWPMIADVDRSLEKSFKMNEISLNNIWQAYFISSDGKLHVGDWSKVDETIREALKGAAWKQDPASVPDSLKETWMAVELGNYKTASAALKKSLNSPKKDVQEAAKKLQEVVKNSAVEELQNAKKEDEDGHHWRAFEICQTLADRFNPTELPSELAEFKKGLLKQAEVKSGTASRKALDTALKALNSGRPMSKKSKTQLEKIVTDFPETDLSREAEQAIQRASDSQ